MKKENKLYKEWFSELVNEVYVKSKKYSNVDYKWFCNNCLFFLTMTFDRYSVGSIKDDFSISISDYSVGFDSFHRVYIYIAEKMYGRRYSRPHFRDRSPMAIAAIDFEGSRYASFQSLGNKNAHIHALWAVSPNDVQSFQKIITSAAFRLCLLKSLPCDRVKFEQYEAIRGSIEGVATYAVKSHIKSIYSPRGDELLRIYPHSNYNSAGVTYRVTRSYPKKDYNILRLRRAMKKNLHEIAVQRQEWE